MTLFMRSTLLAASNSAAASILVKGTIAIAIGLAAVKLARNSRAAVRHTLLAAMFGVLLLLPVATLVEPPVRIALPAEAKPATFPSGGRIASFPPSTGPLPVQPETGRPGRLSLGTVLLIAWAVGLAVFLAPVWMGLLQVRSLRQSATFWRESHGVPVLLQESLAGPMTCGVLRPAIVLPRDAESWSEADLHRALAHEMEHIHRADWLTHCIARAICALYWCHPLVWMAWRQLTLEAEHACDDAVLANSDAAVYADQLVALARRLSASARAPFLAMANRADLSARVSSLLDERRKRGRAGSRAVTLAWAGAALLVGSLAPLTMVASPQQQGPATRILSQSNLVQVPVIVTDANGRDIDGLTAGDFVVTQDDAPQNVVVFDYQQPGAYVLGFYTVLREDHAFRKIGVKLRGNSTALVVYRPGYFPLRPPAPPQPAAQSQARRPGVTAPVLIRKYEPEYSEEARKVKFQGMVLLAVTVDAQGHTAGVRVLHRLGLGLDDKAVEAVRKWQFRPATQDGQPVEAETEVEVVFRLL